MQIFYQWFDSEIIISTVSVMGQQMVFNFRKINIYVLQHEIFNYSGKSFNCIQFNHNQLPNSAS
jgi:hypothetical protein